MYKVETPLFLSLYNVHVVKPLQVGTVYLHAWHQNYIDIIKTYCIAQYLPQHATAPGCTRAISVAAMGVVLQWTYMSYRTLQSPHCPGHGGTHMQIVLSGHQGCNPVAPQFYNEIKSSLYACQNKDMLGNNQHQFILLLDRLLYIYAPHSGVKATLNS